MSFHRIVQGNQKSCRERQPAVLQKVLEPKPDPACGGGVFQEFFPIRSTRIPPDLFLSGPSLHANFLTRQPVL